MSRVKIRTSNPRALLDTLASLGGGTHTVLPDTLVDDVVEVETNNPGFLAFACKRQGYGEVVEQEVP